MPNTSKYGYSSKGSTVFACFTTLPANILNNGQTFETNNTEHPKYFANKGPYFLKEADYDIFVENENFCH